ncbi:LuxR family transcriptional regulator [Streptosporangium sp. 'caverna']|uniref:helix-turn-helix transcriptional regulator n=1 Tax=Streptosporangium sp. 'caverna' TaxID=2202249 RepID=UPI000D7DA921|nr:LuxR family transcriptional regulator [Streptosporangium sp. 'caverna']AWS44280.1 transcriptional regulator [Streptosporangium sp. 'caverna']
MLVEREVQIAELSTSFSNQGLSFGCIGLITGGIGCGKTELLEEAARRARDAGFRVISASCSTLEQSLPYAMIDQLFRDLALAGELPLMPDALRPARGDTWPSPELLRFYHEVLATIAASGPVLLAIDDIQHADEPSLRSLLYLYRRFQGSPVTVMVTHGAQFGIDATTPLGELLFQPRINRVTVGSLSREGVCQLIRFQQGGERRDVDEVVALTGGNPLLAKALLQDPVSARAANSVGDSFLYAALACIHSSGTAGLRTAGAMAVLGGNVSVELLSRLTGLETRITKRLIQALTDSGILSDRGFHHPQVRAAVLDNLSTDEAAELHHRAAVLLHEEGAPNLVLAHHLLAAGKLSRPWATQVLIEAGREALRTDQVSLALKCLRVAEEHAADERERLIINTELATSVWRVKPEVAARKLSALAEPISQGRLPSARLLAMVPGMLWHGLEKEAVSALEFVEASGPTDPALKLTRDAMLLWIQCNYPGVATRIGGLIESIPAHPPTSPSVPDHSGYAALWALASVVQGNQIDTAVATAEQVLQRVRIGDKTLESLTAAISALLYAGRLDLADSWCERLGSEAADRKAPTWQAVLCALRGQVALRRGDLPTASQLVDEALRLTSALGWGVGIGLPLATGIDAAINKGDYQTAEKLVLQPVPERLFETRFGLHYLVACGRYHLAQGHLQAALADFLSCGERIRSWGIDSTALVTWRIGAAETWLRMNNRERAVQLIEEHLTMTNSNQSGVRGAALRVLAMTAPPSRQQKLLAEALELLQASGNRYEMALVLADLSSLHRGLGDPARGRIYARRAWRIAKDCGAAALCRSLFPSAHDRMLSSGPDDLTTTEVIGSLTEAERRVGALAAQGHSNRDIADQLFITVSTVEQHLTRVYRKLDVRHRQDLPSSLAFDEPDRNTA